LRLFVGQATSLSSVEATTIFGPHAGPVEAVIYRCYDGPMAEDTSFVVARGVLA
jgi:hypothetical protein